MRAHTDPAFHQALFAQCGQVMLTINRLPQPVIARVHGIATAAGCQLVAACDLAVASDNARFAVSGINVGLFCSTPGVALSRNLGRKQALELLLTGEFIDAPTAQRQGLINRVAPLDQLDAEIWQLADAICDKSPLAIAHGQGIVLSAIGTAPGRSLRLCQRSHGLQHEQRRRPRRHRRLHRQAQAGVERLLKPVLTPSCFSTPAF
jgi:enoyl-CoA hydratase/carnithine racemase